MGTSLTPTALGSMLADVVAMDAVSQAHGVNSTVAQVINHLRRDQRNNNSHVSLRTQRFLQVMGVHFGKAKFQFQVFCFNDFEA